MSVHPTATPSPRAFDITDPLPQGGTTLLEASAGTGKTWTIASLVTRYVVEGRCTLGQMLVVTFGRAASHELRERVRERLVEAARVVAVHQRGDLDATAVPRAVAPLLPVLLVDDAQEQEQRLLRLRTALADVDSATIATTHQFCHQVLDGLGVAGDTDAHARLVEDLDDLLVEVVDDLVLAAHSGPAEHRPLVPLGRAEALALARDVVSDPQARLEPADADPGTPAGARVAFARRVRDELDRRKRRLGVLGYDDLLSQLADALVEPDAPARQRMRERWHVVLVDEFQDTDPVQWQVLDRAFSGEATVVLIGDPKQAIYAFRGGDVVTYLEAAATAGTHATLGTNQRSDAPLLAAVQTVLRGAALGDAGIVVRDVEAEHEHARLVGAPHPAPFRLRVLDRYSMGVDPGRTASVADLRARVADDLAADVAALLAARPRFDGRELVASDVAVLCRTATQCRLVQESLEAAGVRCVYTGAGSVFRPDSAGRPAAAAGDWLALLQAMEQPHRSDRVRAAALTPFVGADVERLDAEGEALTDRVAEQVRDWALLLRARGVAAVLEAASADGAMAARVLSRPGGERLMTDLRHAGEALHTVARREALGLPALVSWLREQMSDEHVAVAAERARRLDSDASAVQVMTVHVSKGLQFPVVYLPGQSDSWMPPTPRTLRYHDDAGRRCLDVGGDPSPDVLARMRREELAEELRVLYVALTRAQSQVVAWWFPSARNTGPSPLHRLLFGRGPGEAHVPDQAPLPDDRTAIARAREWEGLGGPVVERCETAPPAAPPRRATSAALAVRSFSRDVDHGWTRTSYTGLSSAAEQAAGAAELLGAAWARRTTVPGTAAPEVGPDGSDALAPTSEPETPLRDDEPEVLTPAGPPDPALAAAAGVPSPMAALPVGATFGSLVHAVLEHADPDAPDRGGDWRAELAHHVREQLVRWPVDLDPSVLVDALVAVADTPLGPLAPTTLRRLPLTDRLRELDFELPLSGGDDRRAAVRAQRVTLRDLAGLLRRHLPPGDPLAPYADVVDDPAYELDLRGYLTGSLDLVLRVGGRYLVADYKTNWLGDLDEVGAEEPALTAADYAPARLAAAMGHSSYPLQALLYAVVLHRFLRWRLPGYDPHEHLGGVLYLYVRGMCGPDTPLVGDDPCGVFSWRPPVALVEELSDLLDGRPAPGVAR
ncbi:UvrD-helicase domain-containing protein [Lapillicoccus jejuensis]|uniref:RecBCD enzyme subunit RecB n=1 Tax=Lapillicoccus jejuensis TaxID=402171 RepID=A0A542E6Y0_9MICO|nr:UvrD-helicase domain-containing protein [Lapillicoccus jejuensis]TQJ11077.1 DNA helicase/exodeoxyribonuclease V beta subunit [Lapillicoccus jejuensis]